MREWVLCELMGIVLESLQPAQLALLARSSRSLRDAARSHEEPLLSRVGMVRSIRRNSKGGEATLKWQVHLGAIKSPYHICLINNFKVKVPETARGILEMLWKLKSQHEDEERTLYVECIQILYNETLETYWQRQFMQYLCRTKAGQRKLECIMKLNHDISWDLTT